MLDLLAVFVVLVEDFIKINRVDPVNLGEELVFNLQVLLELRRKGVLFQEVGHPNPDPGNLIDVGWPNPLLGGPDLSGALSLFLAFIEQEVVWHDHLGPTGNFEPRDVGPAVSQVLDFFQKSLRVNDNPVTNHGGGVFTEDPGRNQPQGKLLPVEFNRVPGVVPPLGADNNVRFLTQVVGHLPLSFVSPLASYDYYCCHSVHLISLKKLSTVTL